MPTTRRYFGPLSLPDGLIHSYLLSSPYPGLVITLFRTCTKQDRLVTLHFLHSFFRLSNFIYRQFNMPPYPTSGSKPDLADCASGGALALIWTQPAVESTLQGGVPPFLSLARLCNALHCTPFPSPSLDPCLTAYPNPESWFEASRQSCILVLPV